jgi:predicted nucleotidyltransferase
LKRRTEDPRADADRLTEELRQAFAGRLRSVLLYGSVARGEHVAGRSDTNVLVLLDDIEPTQLAAASPRVRAALDALRAPPLILTWEDWSRAGDAFAIEAADMKDAHVVLHGDDPVEDVTIETQALRLQAERELRGKIVRLHTAMLVVGNDPAELGGLLVASLPAFTTYMRATLRLAGRPVPGDMRGVLTAAAQLVGAPTEELLRVLHARTSGEAFATPIGGPIVAGYDAAARRTAEFIDRFEG